MSALPQLQQTNVVSKASGNSHGTTRFRDVQALKQRILALVTEESYDLAIQELEKYLEHPSEFPTFRRRVERYIQHSIELISAIDAKRGFPGKMALTMARQQELNDRVMQHFRELQVVMARVEWVNASLKAEDLRSTVWVIRSLVYGVVGIVVAALFLELTQGLMTSAVIVAEHEAHRLADYVFGLF